MNDLISRQAAIDAMRELPYGYRGIVWDILNSLPSVQPEQKHGKWILKDKNALDREPKTGEEMFCDQCGEMALGYPFWECDLKPSNFCPNCGARMDGGYTDD